MINYAKVALEYAYHRKAHPEVLKDLLSTGGVEVVSRFLRWDAEQVITSLL
jgi:hypothetical protein